MISQFNFGCGRAGPDRQFFFINGRPCNPSKIQKTFNEVYRSFNTNQSPFVIADFILPTDSCDVNVSPDKRTILLHSENALIAALKEALEARFAPARSTFTVQPSTTQRELPSSARPSIVEAPPLADNTLEETRRSVPNSGITTPEEEEEDLARVPTIGAGGIESTSKPTSAGQQTEGVSEGTIPRKGPLEKQPLLDLGSSTVNRSGAELDQNTLPVTSSDSPVSESITAQPPSPCPRLNAAKAQAKPVQMVLSTRNASWAILPASEEPVLKKRKLDSKKGAISLASLRSQLSSFAAPGSQSVRIQEDEEEMDEDEEDEEDLLASEKSDVVDSTNDAQKDVPLADSEAANVLKIQPSADKEEPAEAVQHAENPVHVNEPLFLNEDIEERHEEVMANKPSGVRIKSEEVDVLMLAEDNSSALDEERLHHLRSLDQSSATSSSAPNVQDQSSSVKTVRTEVLKTKREGLDVTVSMNTAKIEVIWASHLQKQSGNARSSTAQIVPSDHDQQQKQQQISSSAGISNTTNEADAGQALSRMLDKKDFSTMEVVGQFNLGFIITRLRHPPENSTSEGEQEHLEHDSGLDDLFIVDQHASDEKFNFETLQQTTKIASQKLVRWGSSYSDHTHIDWIALIFSLYTLRSYPLFVFLLWTPGLEYLSLLPLMNLSP